MRTIRRALLRNNAVYQIHQGVRSGFPLCCILRYATSREMYPAVHRGGTGAPNSWVVCGLLHHRDTPIDEAWPDHQTTYPRGKLPIRRVFRFWTKKSIGTAKYAVRMAAINNPSMTDAEAQQMLMDLWAAEGRQTP